jgi:hypothetical protein
MFRSLLAIVKDYEYVALQKYLFVILILCKGHTMVVEVYLTIKHT